MHPIVELSCVVALAFPSAAPVDEGAIADAVDAGFAAGDLHGVVAVSVDGELALWRGVGAVGPDTDRTGDLDTPYPLASLTKLWTRACVLRLIAEGELSPDDRVATWIGPVAPPTLTVDHLLRGRSGFPRELHEDPRRSGVDLDEEGRVLPDLVRRGPLPVDLEPGTEERYSNVDAWVLGAVVEAVTDEPFEVAFARLVARPLGLRNTGFADDLPGGPAAAGLERRDGALVPAEAVDLRRRFTSGGMASSARDLLRLADALDDPEFLGVLGPAHFLGADLQLLAGGHLPGYTNALLHDAARRVTVVLLGNVTVDPPELLLARLDAIAAAAGARPRVRSTPKRKLVVESAAHGLPDTPIGRAATALDVAMRADDRDAVQAWLVGHTTMGEDPADADALHGMRDVLDGWQLVGYEERGDEELFLVARGGNRKEIRLTLTAVPGDPARIDDVLLDVAPRGR